MAVSWVEKLLALQDLDMEIRKLKLRLTMIPKEAEKLQQQIAVIENKVKLARSVKAEHELQIKKNENEIAELNGKIEKLQAQSELVKKNTEYQAMLGSIAMLKKSIGDLETSQLELMETIEQDNEAIRKALAAVKPESAPLREELSELAELVNDVKRRGRELLAKRPELRSMVDGEVLPRYEQILQKNAGQPLVAAESDKCGNCHLRLTPQTLNSARSGNITFCDNCMHIIYIPDEQE